MNQQHCFALDWEQSVSLTVDENVCKYVMTINENQTLTVICDLNEKTTRMEKEQHDVDSIELIELVEITEIDMSYDGVRWIGSALNGEPCGYGCLYDENNKLSYSGFMLNGQKTVYGAEFYTDTNSVEYCGSFMEGLRHGWGVLYDKEGNLIYEGKWAFGRNDRFDLRIDCFNEAEMRIHNLLRDMKIGQDCYNNVKELQIMGYEDLESIVIGDECFKSAERVILMACNKLNQLKIGCKSFINTKSLILKSRVRLV